MCAKEISTKANTPNYTPRPPGNGAMNGNHTGKPFSKDNQPSPEAKSAGKLKGKRGQELARALLAIHAPESDHRAACAAYLNIPDDEITIEMMMVYRQAQKALDGQDTPAFNAVTDRAFGKPKEYHEVLDIEVKTEEQITAQKIKKIREMLNEKF